MKKSDVIKHFGSKSAVARALGISPQAVFGWPEKVPDLRAYQIEELTKGQLKRETCQRATSATS